MGTKIRSSQQLYIDADLNLNSKKAVSLLDGVANNDAATVGQMNTAIANAVSGVGNSIHVSVADLAAAKAVASSGRADKMIMMIESLGLYHFDAESTAASDDSLVIRPTDVSTDASAGRWIKMSSVLNNHDLLSNILGNGTYHLSLAERNFLNGQSGTNTGDETASRIATIINGTAAKAAPVDADTIPMMDSAASFALKNLTFANLKTFLKTYFDTQYTSDANTEKVANKNASGGYAGLTLFKLNLKNAAGTITSWFTTAATVARTWTMPDKDGTVAMTSDIVTTASGITDFNAAALAAAPAETASTTGTLISAAGSKVTPVDADSIAISDSAASNILKKLTFANLKTYLFALFSGDVTVNGSGVTAIGANKVANTQLAQMAANTIKGNNTGSAANAADLTIAQIKTMLGLTAANQSTRTYRATPAGTVNGSNTDFTIAALVISGTEEVFKNGMLMNAGAGNDYTIVYGATTTITFLTAPSNTPFADVILVNYSV